MYVVCYVCVCTVSYCKLWDSRKVPATKGDSLSGLMRVHMYVCTYVRVCVCVYIGRVLMSCVTPDVYTHIRNCMVIKLPIIRSSLNMLHT